VGQTLQVSDQVAAEIMARRKRGRSLE